MFFPEENKCEETILEYLCLYAPRSCMLIVNRGDDDAITCAFSRGYWEVNGIAVKAVCGGTVNMTFKLS